MRPFLSDLAEEVGKLLLGYYGRLAPGDIADKGPRDLVSVADKEAEELLKTRILARFPEDGILGEEGCSIAGTSGTRWILDPLDGTTNFIHGLPQFAISIGVEVEGVMRHGCIYAPVIGDMYLASAGEGATINGAPMTVSPQPDLRKTLIATGFADARTSDVLRVSRFERLLNHVGGVRRLGSAALDLAEVARGRMDGFFEWNLNAWDVAAGGLLVQEAGGLVTDGQGGDGWLTSRSLVAGPPALHAKLLECLSAPTPEDRLSSLQEQFRSFVEARGWEPWHTPKNLAMALSVEASELTEIFQWLSPEEAARGGLPESSRLHAGEELSDILAYSLSIANALDLDLAQAFQAKMLRNAEKYPAGGPEPETWGGAKGQPE